MNRNLIQVVLTNINNKKLFQILFLKKLLEIDYLLPKIITFKKFFLLDRKNVSIDLLKWIDRFNLDSFSFFLYTYSWDEIY